MNIPAMSMLFYALLPSKLCESQVTAPLPPPPPPFIAPAPVAPAPTVSPPPPFVAPAPVAPAPVAPAPTAPSFIPEVVTIGEGVTFGEALASAGGILLRGLAGPAGFLIGILTPTKMGDGTLRNYPPRPPSPPPPPPPPPEEQREKNSCRSRYPNYKICERLPQDYIYRSMQQTLNAIKISERNPHLTWHNLKPATGGPCIGIGDHYNVRPGRVASIGCCPCCLASDSPSAQERCAIIW